MDKLKKMKSEYESLNAPTEMYANVSKLFEGERRKRRFIKNMTSIAASFVLASVMLVNVNSSIAHAMSEVPFLSSFVKVVTLGKYEKAEGGYEIDVTTPKIEGLLDKETEEKLNKEFAENANTLILAVEQDIKNIKKEFEGQDVHMGIKSDYIVKTDNEDTLAIDVYVYNVVGSSSTVHNYYNIDKKTGKEIVFNQLFKADSGYVEKINQYIDSEIKRRNEEEDGMYWTDDMDGFKTISENQKFYINNDGNIVICFDKYEIAAGAQGSPEFVIPTEIAREILK